MSTKTNNAEKRGLLDRFFKLTENHTNVRTELAAGLTTFMTMAYILAVNPSILSAAGMDGTAVLIATCIASFIGTMLMGLMANLPFALSAGMGLNAFMAYTIVLGYGYSWQVALLAVFVEGIIFIVLSLTKVREAIFNAIPLPIKKAVSVGIGLFIAFIGLKNSGLVVANSSTLVAITSFTDNFNTSGICALLALVGTIFTFVLHAKDVRGSVLLGIIATWLLGIICQLCGLYVPREGYASLIPSFGLTDFTALGLTFGQCFNVDFSTVDIMNFIVIIFSFLFVDLFDTLGTLIGVSSRAGMLDKQGRLPKIRPALLADAIATTAGAVLGTSTTTTFVESSAGVGAGGRARAYRSNYRDIVPGFDIPGSGIRGDTVVRDRSGADRRRIHDVQLYHRDQVRRKVPDRRYPGIHLHYRNAAVLQRFRGNLPRYHLLHAYQSLLWEGKEDTAAYLCTVGAVRSKIYFPVNDPTPVSLSPPGSFYVSDF